MRFGNTAVVKVSGRSAGPMKGFRPATEVKVGRDNGAKVRTGAEAGVNNHPGANVDASCRNYDWTNACDRPIAIPPTTIAAGATAEIVITPCGPYRLGDANGNAFVITGQNSELFAMTSIKVCRTDYIDGDAWPMDAFAAGGPGVRLGCGSVFFPSLPLKMSVTNRSGSSQTFGGLILGKELAICG